MLCRQYLSAVPAVAAALVFSASSANAEPAHVTHSEALGGLFNTCNGELVFFSGESVTIDKPLADGSLRTQLIIRGTGTGLLANEYVLHFNILLVRASSSLLTLDDEKTTLVSRGSAPNQDVRFHFSSDSPEIIFTVDCHG
jgi:hypothetical protein